VFDIIVREVRAGGLREVREVACKSLLVLWGSLREDVRDHPPYPLYAPRRLLARAAGAGDNDNLVVLRQGTDPFAWDPLRRRGNRVGARL
jgi:hypothetical protein